MADEVSELIRAAHLCRQNGMEHAAFILGREGAEAIKAKRKPRHRMVEVRLNGGPAWIESKRLKEAVEIDD
jgi:hypothetical protein